LRFLATGRCGLDGCVREWEWEGCLRSPLNARPMVLLPLIRPAKAENDDDTPLAEEKEEEAEGEAEGEVEEVATAEGLEADTDTDA
jgi:hypothetical protein